MAVTNIEPQEVEIKEKIAKFFWQSQPFLKEGFCPTKNLLHSTLDKWSLFCVFNLGYYDTLRFNELKNNINGISARMLSVTLKKLEEQMILNRQVFAEVPPRVEYELTDFGRELASRLIDLSSWFIDESPCLKNFPFTKTEK